MPKVFTGRVLSTKTQNTAVVEVTRLMPHKLYRKLLKRSKHYKVDTTGKEVAIGEKVKIVETKPISKNKYFRVQEIVKEQKS